MSARVAGMISPTSGEAVINGMSIRDQMGRIRQSLGVCPQFDILWPNITVAEHLQLYAAIKGYRGGSRDRAGRRRRSPQRRCACFGCCAGR